MLTVLVRGGVMITMPSEVDACPKDPKSCALSQLLRSVLFPVPTFSSLPYLFLPTHTRTLLVRTRTWKSHSSERCAALPCVALQAHTVIGLMMLASCWSTWVWPGRSCWITWLELIVIGTITPQLWQLFAAEPGHGVALPFVSDSICNFVS